MFKLIPKIISAVMAFIISLMPIGSDEPQQKCSPEFSGTFLQSWMSSSWDDARWQTEIDNMRQAGVKYLILQDVANKAYKSSGGGWTVYYDTDLAVFEDAAKAPDVIEAALRNCKGTDIKVFVGLAMFDDFWTEGAMTGQYAEMCAVAADMAEEIYGKYYSRYSENFYGWYFTPEFNNILTCQVNIGGMCRGLNEIIARIDALNPSLPLLLSPFYARYLAAGPVVTLSNLVRMLNTINLRDCDIFAPQDAVGALWIREKDLEMTWKLYSEAVKTADADIRLWANCENFTLAFADTAIDGILTRPATENTEAVPATLDRFTRQMKTAAKYAENIITFSYNHYYSPELVSPAYIETYLDYVKNGYVLEGEAPVMGGFRKSAVDGGVSLDWDAASDNFGIAYYRIEKNGKFLTRIETCYSSPELVYADIGGSVGDEYTITAYDAAGNVSAAVTAK